MSVQNNEMVGYKICNQGKYEVGKTYSCKKAPELPYGGFVYYNSLVEYFNYRWPNKKCAIFEVEIMGDISESWIVNKTNKIRVIRQLNWTEVLDAVNVGKGCTGYKNSGNNNSGNLNSGDNNSGHYNSGDKNSGYNNSGDNNSGDLNSGSYNSGSWNTGDANSGNHNSGDGNMGSCNSGSRNVGYKNSGDDNSGSWNSGGHNSGNHNSGSWNVGNKNSGSWNIGDKNSGDWNSGNNSNGVFCTKEPEIFIFDKPSKITLSEWRETDAYKILRKHFRTSVWVCSDNMTKEEKSNNPRYVVDGGYLKTFTFKESCNDMWNNLTNNEKLIIKSIPNFDKQKFKHITGIDA